MKTKLSILFLFIPLYFFAQTKISGRVYDKETLDPIPNVVVYSNVGNTITLTDNEGNYNLIVNQPELVYFRQLAYDFFTTSTDTLLLNSNVYLTKNIVFLNEVVIAPENAKVLLNKAIRNLYEHIQKNNVKHYLYHIEEETDMGGNREVYASIKTELSNTNNRTGKLDWKINLVQMDKKATLNESFRPKNLRIMQIELFPQKISVFSELNNYVCTFYENDADQIIIKALPKKLDKKHYRYYLYTINKQDTVLSEITSQSLSNSSEITEQNFLNLDRQFLNHFSRLKFVQDKLSDSYYLKEIQNIGIMKMSINSLKCTFSFKVNSKEISNNSVSSLKKIKPYDYELFETDFPNSPGFWKEYVTP